MVGAGVGGDGREGLLVVLVLVLVRVPILDRGTGLGLANHRRSLVQQRIRLLQLLVH